MYGEGPLGAQTCLLDQGHVQMIDRGDDLCCWPSGTSKKGSSGGKTDRKGSGYSTVDRQGVDWTSSRLRQVCMFL